MRINRMVIAFAVATAISVFTLAHQPPKRFAIPPDGISAPLHYTDTMLVLVDADGIALVVFDSPAAEYAGLETTTPPVTYRFRYKANGNSVINGSGHQWQRSVV